MVAIALRRPRPASQVLDLAVHGLDHGDNARIHEATNLVNLSLDVINLVLDVGLDPCVLHVLDDVKATVNRAHGSTEN